MSTINYTYNVIVDRFRQFAAGHFQLRRFTHGEISQADLEKEAEWPWMHVKPRAINYSPGTRAFSFEIFISDLPRDKEDKTGYQAESITDCSLIFQDLINEIHLGHMFGDDVVLTRPVNSEPFVEQYTHTLTGVTGTIELNLDYDWSACSIPASWNYNTPTDSGTDGWGALQFIESLDQNGVFVSLDGDVEAPGNSYYYGTNASGVKGWYQLIDQVGITCEDLPDCATIISIVDDIAALQTDVALKANTADLGATAFSNDYNDLDNLPSIPSIAGLATVTYVDQQDALKVDKVAGKGLSTNDYTTAEQTKLAGIEAGAEVNVNADWNAVSGDAQILNKPSIPAAQVNSDWNATSGVAQILNKPTIPSIAGLVPETRTITINGTTQDLSANRTFTIATGLTVGTTPITSGTVGRVLFEGTGNVLQESANFFWDNTNSRLGIGTASPAYGLDVNTTLRVTGFSYFTAYFTAVQRLQFNNGTVATNWGQFRGQSNGVFRLVDSSEADFTRLQFGGGTTAFPALQRSGAALCVVDGTGTGLANLLIGTTTDAGFKLDVNGSTRIVGQLTLNNNIVIPAGTGSGVFSNFFSHNTTPFQYGLSYAFQTSSLTSSAVTSGSRTSFSDVINWSQSSGSADFASFRVSTIINQTGTATGITRGIHINPTLTAAADWRAIEVASGITILGAATTAKASLRIPSGTAPTSPVNGDIWFDGTLLKMQIGGVTKTFTLL